MKKLLLGLGTVVSATTPIVAVVACGDEKTPTTPAPEAPVPDVPAGHTALTNAQILEKVNAVTAASYTALAEDGTALTVDQIKNFVADWNIPAQIAPKANGKHDYDKENSWIDGQFTWATFNDGALANEDFIKIVSSTYTALKYYENLNNDHADSVKLGAALIGKAYDKDHDRNHQVTTAELKALLTRFKTLAAATTNIVTVINESITMVDALHNY